MTDASTWQLPAADYVPHVQPLQIIAPRAGLTNTNVYYQAYPGIPYTRPVGVLGGAWPVEYKLLAFPAGMTVGEHHGDLLYGVISWPSPGTPGTYNVTLQVTDQEGTVEQVAWSILVTTANTIFVDTVNGHPSPNNGGTGAGTLANPFKSMNDWYAGTSGSGAATRFDTTYRGYHIYYRRGTYQNDAFTDGNGICEMQDKPLIHMAYPGETVTFDFQTSPSSTWGPSGGVSNVAICGITFHGAPNSASNSNENLRVDSGGTDLLFYNNTWTAPALAAISGTNPACLMISSNTQNLRYVLLKGNTIQGNNGYDFFLGYNTQFGVAEENSFSGCSDNGIYLKIGNSDWTIRNNIYFSGANTGDLVSTDAYTPASASIEVCYNLVKTTGSGWLIGLTASSPEGSLWSYRNTWIVSQQTIQSVTASSMTVINDVVQYKNSGADSHGWLSVGGGTFTSFSASGEECVGTATYTDSNGNLMGAFSSYVGTRGYQVVSGSSPTTTSQTATSTSGGESLLSFSLWRFPLFQ